MMRRVADLQESLVNSARAAQFRAEASRLLPHVLKLEMPGQGAWYALHEDGMKVEVRHVFDFATIGLTIPQDPSPTMRNDMVSFVEKELLTKYWLRAQSLSDPAASVSDRPDRAPMGAFCARPPETIAAMWEVGKYRQALECFGYKPDLLNHVAAPDKTPRGFAGTLSNVWQGNRASTIRSSSKGLDVSRVP